MSIRAIKSSRALGRDICDISEVLTVLSPPQALRSQEYKAQRQRGVCGEIVLFGAVKIRIIRRSFRAHIRDRESKQKVNQLCASANRIGESKLTKRNDRHSRRVFSRWSPTPLLNSHVQCLSLPKCSGNSTSYELLLCWKLENMLLMSTDRIAGRPAQEGT